MRWTIFLSALLVAACSHSQPDSGMHLSGSASTQARASLSPAAPVNLTYHIENAAEGLSQRVDLAVDTRLPSGTLLVEVARQEGVEILGDATHRIDLAAATRPIALQIQVLPVGTGEHFLVLLLTVDTAMGPMSRSFRIDMGTTDGSGAGQ